MMQLKPVASASPDGGFDLNDHRLIQTLLDKTGKIEAIETAHRFEIMNVVYDRGIYTKEFRPTAPAPIVGSNRAVRIEFGYMRRNCGGYCKYQRSAESRSHNRTKKPYRRLCIER